MPTVFNKYNVKQLTKDIYDAAERRMGYDLLMRSKDMYDEIRKPACLKTPDDEVRYILALAKHCFWSGKDHTYYRESDRVLYGFRRTIKIGNLEYEWSGNVEYLPTGYDCLLVPLHPEANPAGYVAAHRILAEEKIGRHLRKNEVVHHVDYNPANNAPKNLDVMTHIQHMKRHRREIEVRIYEKCAICGRRTRVPLAEHVRDTVFKKRTEWYCGKRCAAKAKHKAGIFDKPPKEMVTLECAKCNKQFEREAKRVRYKQNAGQSEFYCSYSCSNSVNMKRYYDKQNEGSSHGS